MRSPSKILVSAALVAAEANSNDSATRLAVAQNDQKTADRSSGSSH